MHTVVIVEPHPLFRLGLRQLICDILPEASVEGYDYAALDSSRDPTAQACDLVLLSITPGSDAAKLASKAASRYASKRILLLGDEGDIQNLSQELPTMVAGCVAKEAPPEILQASVRLVLAGGTCFPAGMSRWETKDAPSAAGTIIAEAPPTPRYEPVKWENTPSSTPAPGLAEQSDKEDQDCEFATPIRPGSAAHRESQLLGLTPRQYEVLVLLARGYPMKKVGRALNISVATAKAHTETLYQRLDVHNRNAAVYAAVSRGATLGWANIANPQNQEGKS